MTPPSQEPSPRVAFGALIAASIGAVFFLVMVIMVVAHPAASAPPILISTPTAQDATTLPTFTAGATATHVPTATADARAQRWWGQPADRDDRPAHAYCCSRNGDSDPTTGSYSAGGHHSRSVISLRRR